MANEGNTAEARRLYRQGKNQNLRFLLENRYSWMNRFIEVKSTGIELGSGTGVTKDFIICNDFKISDFSNDPWLDLKMIDAQKTQLPNEKFDFVILSNMIHHVAQPTILFKEVLRILKPGGTLLIQEIHTSFFCKLLLFIMRHEGWDECVNVFDPDEICNDPTDLWSANCSVPRMLFDDQEKFTEFFSDWEIVHDDHSEFFIYLNSGGVVAKTVYIPLPFFLLNFLRRVDSILTSLFPNVFALQRRVVLKKAFPTLSIVGPLS